MSTYWTIEEYIPSDAAIGSMGYWYLLDDIKSEHDKALRAFEQLKKDNREVRLIENTETIVAT